MASLTELGAILHEEHFHIVVWICDLQNRTTGTAALQPLDPNCPDDKRQLETLILGLDQVLVHHAFEETVLFPLVRDRGGSELTMLLTDEHIAIEPIVARLQSVVRAILARGPGNGLWSECCAVSGELIAEMMAHLEKEELGVVRQLDCLLDADTDHRLAVERSDHKHMTQHQFDRDLQPHLA
ncbi:MAG: hemerythrin domain-containing protein [Rhodospirillales bacterium]|nr:hemerythrin domain-containing protein [Rhodospirillales bacterium]